MHIRTVVDRDRWHFLCQNHTSKEIVHDFHIGRSRQKKLSDRHGIKPFMRCCYCGLNPPEMFKHTNSRICMECDAKPKSWKVSNCMTDWNREQSIYAKDKELSKTPLWLATEGPLSYWVKNEFEVAV